MGRDTYHGVRNRVVDSFIDKDGNVRLRNGSGNNYGAYIVGSGTLVDGLCTLNCSTLGIDVGGHTLVFCTSMSGSTPESRLEWAIDQDDKLIHVSGTTSDGSDFGYMIVNPGLASPKVS